MQQILQVNTFINKDIHMTEVICTQIASYSSWPKSVLRPPKQMAVHGYFRAFGLLQG